ncbi:MAG: M24 family metallopeptidase [Acidobacteriota bacterium]
MELHTGRIGRLRALLREAQADAFISAFGPHLRYFAGFSGSNGMIVITQRSALFFTDFRYKEQSASEVPAFRRTVVRGSLIEAAAKGGAFKGLGTIVFNEEVCSYKFIDELRAQAREASIRPGSLIAERCMTCKDEGEIADLAAAAAISDRVFTDLLTLIRPGITELDIAAEIVSRHRRYGAEKDAFDVIAASGPNSSLPHARPTARAVASGDFITLDFGCVFRGYHSDMTRTIAVGRASAAMKKVYAAVLEAQKTGVRAARPGITGRQLDASARRVIARHGYGKYFLHGLGHGIGLQIHEEPRVSKTNNQPLPEGAVITIEPGIYLSGQFGVRIEDDVVLRNGGCEVITASPKELIIL